MEILSSIDKIIVSYLEEFKKQIQLPNEQKCLFISGAFKRKSTPKIQNRYIEVVVVVIIPKSATLLLQTLDVGADLHCAI